MTTDHSTPVPSSPDSANRPLTFGGIYAIRHLESGKMYIGSAKDFANRWRIHSFYLNNCRHHSMHLQNAWNKYGCGAFVFEILWHVEYADDLISIEQEFIDQFKTCSRDNEYNISPTAGSKLGVKASAETRAKLAAAHMGHVASPEARAKMADAHRGHVASPEARAKIANANRNRTPETRAKLATAARNCTPETRAKLAAAAVKSNKQRADDRREKARAILRERFGGPPCPWIKDEPATNQLTLFDD